MTDSDENLKPTHPAPGTPYDAVVVFGAAVWPNGRPSPALRRRTLHAVSLVKSGLAGHLLVTGGTGKHPPSEARVMKHIAQAHGLSSELIFTEETGTSTFHSARECRKIMRRNRWSSALIVTDPYHIPRACFIFRSLGFKADGSAPAGGKESNRSWRWCLYYVREFLAFPWYCILAIQGVIYLRRT